MKSRYLDPQRPRLFAHRGSSADHPENTLPAFRAAVQAGLPYLEMDVWATRDGRVVVHHDHTLRRLCGRFRRVSTLDLDDLRQLDAGYGYSPDGGLNHPFRGRGVVVPLLEEVLEEFPEALLNIEIKQEKPAIEARVLETVRRCGAADRVLLAAENDRVMRRLRRICGAIPTSCCEGEVVAFYQWFQGKMGGEFRTPAVAMQIPETYGSIRLVTPETLQAAHAAGLEVHVWTVNEPDDMRRLLAMGVDGVMSDRPGLLVRVAEEFQKQGDMEGDKSL